MQISLTGNVLRLDKHLRPVRAQPPGTPLYLDVHLPSERAIPPITIPAFGAPRPAAAAVGDTAQLAARMRDLAARFPELARVRDVGDSHDKVAGTAPSHDLLALELGRNSDPATPHLTMIGGLHAREVANPELLLRWAEQQLTGYGRDADATALLDTRRVTIVPDANPDGHARVVAGLRSGDLDAAMQRKSSTGVDLNRNFDHRWNAHGAVPPDDIAYAGPSPASEPEVQALQRMLTDDPPNLAVDWHSHGGLVLTPEAAEASPDTARNHAAIAARLAAINGYKPTASTSLYPASGTAIDFVVGRLGRPAVAIETGLSFHPGDAELAETARRNLPVMTYAARIADAPAERVLGPDVGDVQVAAASPATADIRPGAVTVTARVTGPHATTVAAAEAALDPATPPGRGTPLMAADGRFDSADEAISGSLPIGDATAGPRLLYVRARTADGNWGPATPQWMPATS